MEKFRTELITFVGKIVGVDAADKVDRFLTKLLVKYEITEKSTEIVEYECDGNIRIVKQYIASLRLEGKSEKTLEQYARAIKKMLEAIRKPIGEITTNDIRFHLANYQSTGVSKRTLDNERRFLSAFFAWLTVEEIIDKNPMLRIKRVKQDRVLKKPFTDEEIEKIRECATKKKEKALVEFLLSTGCRVSEVSGVKIKDIDFDKLECTVFGKGSKERKVYISERCMYYLNKYLDGRKEGYLFTGKKDRMLKKSGIESMLKKIGEKAGVDKVHPHRFRRTFATNALNKGMPIQHVQKLLGHSSMDTTMIYCVVDMDTIKMEHKKVS